MAMCIVSASAFSQTADIGVGYVAHYPSLRDGKSDLTNQYILLSNATGIQQPAKPISPVYLANEYEKTNRMDFLREKRSFLNNPLGKINAQLNGEIKVMKTEGQDGTSLFASESVVDFIETDYK